MTRAEHLAWCKQRALELLETGDVQQAFTSMVSDVGKHHETAGHTAIHLGALLLMGGHLESPVTMRKFIEGFH